LGGRKTLSGKRAGKKKRNRPLRRLTGPEGVKNIEKNPSTNERGSNSFKPSGGIGELFHAKRVGRPVKERGWGKKKTT